MFRIAVLLIGLLAVPGIGFAQVPAVHTPARPIPPTAPGRPAAAPAGPMAVDVNSADEKTLESLPGVGPARAKAIVANRPYTDKQQLVGKKALPPAVYSTLQDRLALVNVNTTSAADMAKILPNVGPIRSQQIVDKRPYASLQDLVAKGALTQGVLDGLRGLVTTGP